MDDTEQVKAQLRRAYYNGLDHKGWSSHEEADAVKQIEQALLQPARPVPTPVDGELRDELVKTLVYMFDYSEENLELTSQQWAERVVDRKLTQLFAAHLQAAVREADALLSEVMEPFDENCHYDHHGYCQAHFLYEDPCPFGRAKERLQQLKKGTV